MTTLFISDLHLDPERPAITELFGRFIDDEARGADALYILGDLFEAWVGDDDPSDTGAFVAGKLRGLHEAGVPVHFIRGNRDFLLGEDYARRAGMAILPDPAVVMLYGKPVLLFAQQARAASKAHQSGLQAQGQMESITDASPDTVEATFARHGIDRIIHGHTHRPKVHETGGGTRIVLGDWYEQGSVLRVDREGFGLSAI